MNKLFISGLFLTAVIPLQVMAAVGELIITKSANGDSDSQFSFSVNEGPPVEATEGDSVFMNLDPGEYSITEIQIPIPWKLDSVSCMNAGGVTGSPDIETSTITGVVIESGQTTNCTFSNAIDAVAPEGEKDKGLPAQGECGIDGLGNYVKFTTGGGDGTEIATSTGGNNNLEANYTQSTFGNSTTFQLNAVTLDGEALLVAEVVGGIARYNPIWSFTPALLPPTPLLATGSDKNFSQFALCVYDAVGSFSLTKTVESGSGEFTFKVECKSPDTEETLLLNESVVLEASAGASATEVVFSNVPIGAICTATEISADPNIYENDGPQSATIVADGAGVTIANTLSAGSLKLSKTLSNGGSGFNGDFSIEYNCGPGYSGSKAVSAGSAVTVENIPSGSSCTVTEPNLPNAPTGYSWSNPVIKTSPVNIVAGSTAEVAVENALTRDLGKYKITKTSDVDGTFIFNTDCNDDTYDKSDISITTTEGTGSHTSDEIPTGVVCTITEEPHSDFNSESSPQDGEVTIVKGETPVSIEITNTRKRGQIELIKTFKGVDGEVDLFIKRGAVTLYTANNAGDGASTGKQSVPTGTYNVGESEVDGTNLADYSSDIACVDAANHDTPVASKTDILNLDVTVGENQDIVCTITNTYQSGKLTLQKIVENPEGYPLANLEPSDWGLSATGQQNGDSLSANGPVAGPALLLTDRYMLSESSTHSRAGRYSASAWSCTGTTQDGNAIDLALQENAVCKITNTYIPICETAFAAGERGFRTGNPKISKGRKGRWGWAIITSAGENLTNIPFYAGASDEVSDGSGVGQYAGLLDLVWDGDKATLTATSENNWVAEGAHLFFGAEPDRFKTAPGTYNANNALVEVSTGVWKAEIDTSLPQYQPDSSGNIFIVFHLEVCH